MQKKVKKVIEKLIRSGQRDFIIFPYGKYGKWTEQCLKEQGIKPKAIVDNYLSKENSNIKSIEFLESDEAQKCIVLFSGGRRDIYYTLRKMVYERLPKNQVEDLFGKYIVGEVSFKKKIYHMIRSPKSRESFLISKINNRSTTKLLDVGCGNSSVLNIKRFCDKVYYIGIDVGDYNQTEESLMCMDEYIIVPPSNFAEKMGEFDDLDVIISNHNLEHCDEPVKVLQNMTKALKKNGLLYLAFPSEVSATFLGGREGCLNFYDDCTHQHLPEYEKVIATLQENGMEIKYKTKSYRPFIMRMIGKRNEEKSREMQKVLEGTWEYYGFESIIWARKN